MNFSHSFRQLSISSKGSKAVIKIHDHYTDTDVDMEIHLGDLISFLEAVTASAKFTLQMQRDDSDSD